MVLRGLQKHQIMNPMVQNIILPQIGLPQETFKKCHTGGSLCLGNAIQGNHWVPIPWSKNLYYLRLACPRKHFKDHARNIEKPLVLLCILHSCHKKEILNGAVLYKKLEIIEIPLVLYTNCMGGTGLRHRFGSTRSARWPWKQYIGPLQTSCLGNKVSTWPIIRS